MQLFYNEKKKCFKIINNVFFFYEHEYSCEEFYIKIVDDANKHVLKLDNNVHL